MANKLRLVDANALMTQVSGYVDEPDYQHIGEDWRNGAWAIGYEISIAPTVDAVPVVHGRLEKHDDVAVCSVCRTEFNIQLYDMDNFNYCHYCGSIMDGGMIYENNA